MKVRANHTPPPLALLVVVVSTLKGGASYGADCVVPNGANKPEFLEYWRGAKSTAREACLSSWVNQQGPLTNKAVTRLLEDAPGNADALGAAVTLLNFRLRAARAADDATIALTLDAGRVALASDQNKVASQAFTAVLEREPNAPARGPAFDQARYGLAVTEEAAGETEKAVVLWRQVIDHDPRTTSAVERSVAALTASKRDADVRSLCAALTGKERTDQLRACLESGWSSFAGYESAWIEGVARLGTLTQRELTILRTTPAVRERLPGLKPCSNTGDSWSPRWTSMIGGGPATPANVFGFQSGPNQFVSGTSGLYGELSRNERSRGPKSCFSACAAVSCLADIQRSGTCDAPASVASYADALADRTLAGDTAAKKELRTFIDALFGMKGGFYRELDGARHHGTPSLPPKETSRALFHLHVSLAYIFHRVGEGASPWEKVSYHVERARTFWKKVSSEPLPEAVFAGLNP
jgi:hypothetical protein